VLRAHLKAGCVMRACCRRPWRAACLLGLLFFSGVFPARARAELILITARADLVGNDSVDWGGVGPSGTVLPNPFLITSAGRMTLTVSKPFTTNNFQRVDQNNGWRGNFAPGARLLWTGDPSGEGNNPITLDFPSLISAGGAQIQAEILGAFVARIEAFDAGGTRLASFDQPGNSDGKVNTAIFLGIRSDSGAVIDRLSFSLVSATDNTTADFAINQFDFDTRGSGAQLVPEPSSITLLGIGLVGLLGYRWRRRKLRA
jgi:hypothetical protein